MSSASSPADRAPTTATGSKRKRVVPEGQRKRTAISCDRCKTRRAKCLRNSENEECSNCVTAGVACESTLPRKQRVYGSKESFSLRYRALDALIPALLPDVDVRDVDALLAFGRARGIPMPEPDSWEINHEVFHAPQAPPTPASDGTRDVSRLPNSSTPPLRATPKRIRDETLVHTPNGLGHYVGPSSSLGFAAVARRMVVRISSNQNFALSPRQSQNTNPSDAKPTSKPAIEIADDRALTPIESTGTFRPQDGGLYMRVLDAQERDDRSDFIFTLPGKATAETLVGWFFEHVHSNYPLFHRTIFAQRFDSMWTSNTHPDESDPGWICVLCLVFVFGAQACDPFGKQFGAIQKRYLRIVRSYVDHLVSTTSLQNIQALMLLQLYYHNAGERNASWMYLGCAARMAIALGMHREGANVGFDALEQNIRKQIFWTVYVFERNLSIIFGRPSAFEEREITISFPEDAIESSIGVPGLTAVTVSLTRLAFRAKQEIYNASQVHKSDAADTVTALARRLLQDLQVWYNTLPAHLRVGRPASHAQQARAVLLLEIIFHHTRSLVTRPLLISRVNKQIDMVEQASTSERAYATMSEEALHMADQCVADAHQVVVLGLRLIKEGLFNGTSWLDVYYLYQSCFVVCFNFMPQLADFPEPSEDAQRKSDVEDIYTAMRNRPLAATFRTFTQVGSQFAALVGALKNVPRDAMSNENYFENLGAATDGVITATPITAPAYPSQPPGHMKIYDSQPPAQTALGAHVNQQDWMNATQIPWDFQGRTTYGEAHGFSQEWYAVQAGTYDDMMFPTVVGGAFGQKSMQNEWGSNGFRMGDDWANGAVKTADT